MVPNNLLAGGELGEERKEGEAERMELSKKGT